MRFLESQAFLATGSFLVIISLIFGNMDSSSSINAPTSVEEMFNFLLIILIFTLGYGSRAALLSRVKLFQRISSWPKFLQVTFSTITVLILVGITSIPAVAIREAIDPSFKSQHLQSESDIKAAADKAAADKAAADKAAADKAAADKAAADKAAADKAAADKAADMKPSAKPTVKSESSAFEKLAGFTSSHIRSFKTIVSNINGYVSAVNSGNNVRASQICDLLDDNYNGSIRGVYSTSAMVQIEELLDNAKDAMYAGVTDCTRGFRKSRIDLIGDSVSEFILASKYLDGLVMVSQVK
jgi:hypothetical protein